MLSLMDSLTIDKLDLDNVTTTEAVQSLTIASKRADPKGEGVKFVLRPMLVDGPEPRNVTLHIAHRSLRDTLHAFRSVTNYDYFVGEHAIQLANSCGGDYLITRKVSVPEEFFSLGTGGAAGGILDVSSQLQKMGLPLPTGQSAKYDRTKRMLTLVGGFDENEKLEQLLFRFYCGK